MSKERKRPQETPVTRGEYRRQLLLAQQKIDLLNRVVWNQPSFPPEFRPPIEEIKKKLVIGDPTEEIDKRSRLILHPWLNDDIRQESEEVIAQSKANSYINHAAGTLSGQVMVLSPRLFVTNPRIELLLLRTLVHEVGHWIMDYPRRINPRDFSAYQREAAERMLLESFSSAKRPEYGDLYIIKKGYRELFYHRNWGIADVISHPMVLDAVELFPLLYELVSIHILAFEGNIDEFDRRVANKDFMQIQDESHPGFAIAGLYAMYLLGGWRNLFEAITLRDLVATEQAIIQLLPTYPRSGVVFTRLLEKIRADEENISTQNQAFLQQLTRLGSFK